MFWLRSNSPLAALNCTGCSLGSALDPRNFQDTAVATEVLSAVLSTSSLNMLSGQVGALLKAFHLVGHWASLGTVRCFFVRGRKQLFF